MHSESMLFEHYQQNNAHNTLPYHICIMLSLPHISYFSLPAANV